MPLAFAPPFRSSFVSDQPIAAKAVPSRRVPHNSEAELEHCDPKPFQYRARPPKEKLNVRYGLPFSNQVMAPEQSLPS